MAKLSCQAHSIRTLESSIPTILPPVLPLATPLPLSLALPSPSSLLFPLPLPLQPQERRHLGPHDQKGVAPAQTLGSVDVEVRLGAIALVAVKRGQQPREDGVEAVKEEDRV